MKGAFEGCSRLGLTMDKKRFLRLLRDVGQSVQQLALIRMPAERIGADDLCSHGNLLPMDLDRLGTFQQQPTAAAFCLVADEKDSGAFIRQPPFEVV